MSSFKFSPSNISWVKEMNCSCDFGSNCIRPSLFTKPVLCLHSSINVKNFTKYIANPVNTSTTIIQQQQQLPSTNYYEYNLMWMYFLITFVIILQVSFFFLPRGN